ncbi:YARHG domain-containing protein [Methylobacterium durans]|uniref:YARHG domain-containing protein n=1 Tax=Methylobacterium durans TaxID=2202825 RepID=A0A2U8WAJ0_9HYPH|nr:YARHG domain-containing protein [Methylobacterium durans]
MRLLALVRAALVCASLPLAGQAQAAFPCDELWGERNAVYAEAGYCFRTARGIRAFGNANCRYDDIRDVPLSARDRAKVADIVREERRNGCGE